MRPGGRQPPHHLQLALIRQDRIRSYSRRLSPDFRRYAPAESGQQQSSGGPRGELHKLIFLEGSSSGRALGDRKRGAEPAAAATATVLIRCSSRSAGTSRSRPKSHVLI